MKKNCISLYSFVIFVLIFIPSISFGASTNFQIRLRLETAGLNNVIIKGSVEGEFDLTEAVTEINLEFNNSSDPFEYLGDGGFTSLAGEPKRVRKSIRKTFRSSALDYLKNGTTVNLPNTATLIGSFVSKSTKTRLVCSSFGYIEPSQDIVYGQYQLTIVGVNRKGEQVLNAQGTVDVAFLPIN